MNLLAPRLFAALPRRMTVAVCVVSATALLLADRQAVLLGSFTDHSALVDTAAAFDLTVGLTLLTWWILGRELAWRPVTLVPLFFASLAVASLTLPPEHRAGLRMEHLLAAPLELLAMAFVARKVVLGRRAFRRAEEGEGDVQASLERAAAEALGPGRLAGAIAYEMSVLHYGLFARGRRPVRADALTHHRKTAYGAMVLALLMATAVEVVAMHFLVGIWSHRVAWILTALGVYGAVWIYGDWNALRRRPTRVEAGVLRIRFGLRWRLDVPLSAITSIRAPTREERATRRGVDLRLALPGAGWVVLELDRPIRAEGIYGLRRSVRTLGLGLDEPRRLEALVAPDPTSNEERT
jgi:hypothetical protein